MVMHVITLVGPVLWVVLMAGQVKVVDKVSIQVYISAFMKT